MKRYSYPVLILLLLGMCGACHRHNHLEIKGRLSNGDLLDMVQLAEVLPDKLVLIDSAVIRDGRFLFEVHLEKEGVYRLLFGTDQEVTMVLKPDDRVYFDADAQDIVHSYQVEGAEGAVLMQAFYKERNQALLEIDSLKLMLYKNRYEKQYDSLKFMVNQRYEQIYIEQQAFTKKFVEDHLSSLASVVAIFQPVGATYLFETKTDLALFELLDSAMMQSYPDSPHTQALRRYVIRAVEELERRKAVEKALAIGKVLPEFVLPDSEGNLLSLRTFANRKVVLYFWESANPLLVKMQKDLAQWYLAQDTQDLSLIGVSLDKNPYRWQEQIIPYVSKWVHLIESKGMQSHLKQEFLLDSIPVFFVLDENNIIRERYDSFAAFKKYYMTN